MKKIFLSYLSLFCFSLSFSQSLDWIQLTTGDVVPTSDLPVIQKEIGMHNLLDANNNYYNFGRINGNADLNPGSGIQNVSLGYYSNFYVQKLTANGDFLWGFGFDNVKLLDAVIDKDNNLIIAGEFYDTIDIDPGTSAFYLNAVYYDHFIMKVDENGNFISGYQIGDSTQNEYIHSICIDNNNNLFILGMIDGNSGDLDPGPGYTSLNATWGELLLMKLDETNNLIWANKSDSKIGNKINCGPDNQPVIYGTFWVNASFDFFSYSYDMNNTSNGMFFWKIDENANYVWAYTLDYGTAEVTDFVIDNLNSIYFTGIFDDTLDFDPSSNITMETGNNQMFVQKIDQNANLQWYSTFGLGNPVISYSIAIDSNYHVYPSGEFTGTINFSNNMSPEFHNSNGDSDYFILKLDEDGNSLWSISSGDSDEDLISSVVADKSGNVFATGSIFGNMDVDPEETVYSVSTLYADVFNLKIASSKPSICMVTVDSLSTHNIIYWDKTLMQNIDSIFIYRETQTNNYEWIGTVSIDSAGMFIDTVSQLYFPYTGNPNMGTYRYKIQTLDRWGNVSRMSRYHNTIFATNNFGTFEWNPYLIEGAPTPIPELGSYLLWRDDTGNGNWNVIGAVAGTQTTITDPDYWNFPQGKWRVLTDWTISCDPERVGVNTSRSNIKNTGAMNEISENDFLNIDVFPNPAHSYITIQNHNIKNNYFLTIYDVVGNTVKSELLNGNVQLNISSIDTGIYLLVIETPDGKFSEKLVIE